MIFRAQLAFTLTTLLLSTSVLAAHSHPDPIIRKVVLPNRTVEVLIESPEGEGPHPLLVIAPGKSDDAEHGVYPSLAGAARKLGFVTLRFNWGFRKSTASKSEAPSADLKQEAEDLLTVLTSFTRGRVNQTLEIDPKKVVLFAEGFAARVAMMPEADALGENAQALLLSNPECTKDHEFSKVYSPLVGLTKPIDFVIPKSGNECNLASATELVKVKGSAVSIKTPAKAALLATLTENLEHLGWTKAVLKAPVKVQADPAPKKSP